MRIVLDACVLANFSLCDTLLRLAEPPALFQPRWTDDILAETVRTLESKLGWSRKLTTSLEQELRVCFPDAWVLDYQELIPLMNNDDKDRHVLAAAVRSSADAIVTFNLRHFQAAHILPWKVAAMHPQDFLISLLEKDYALVRFKLNNQARERKRTLNELLAILAKTVPDFAERVRELE